MSDDHEGAYTRAAANRSDLWGSPEFTERPEWHAEALCGRNGILGDDAAKRVRIMFPTRGEDVNVALNVCEGCPVAAKCKESLELSEIVFAQRFGVWGGTTGAVRRLERRTFLATAGYEAAVRRLA